MINKLLFFILEFKGVCVMTYCVVESNVFNIIFIHYYLINYKK